MLIQRTKPAGRANMARRLSYVQRQYPWTYAEWLGFLSVLQFWFPTGRVLADLGAAGAEAALSSLAPSRLDGIVPWLAREYRRRLRLYTERSDSPDPVQTARGSLQIHRAGIRDWYLATRPDIFRFDYGQAQNAAAAWHAEMEARATTEVLSSGLDAWKRIRHWPDGSWLGKFVARDRQQQQLRAVGKALGHCYQEAETAAYYAQHYAIYTLFDPVGQPRWTAAIEPAAWAGAMVIREVRGPYNGLVLPQDFAKLQEALPVALLGVAEHHHHQSYWDAKAFFFYWKPGTEVRLTLPKPGVKRYEFTLNHRGREGDACQVYMVESRDPAGRNWVGGHLSAGGMDSYGADFQSLLERLVDEC